MKGDILLMDNTIPLANEAFFVLFAHVGIYLVVAKVTLAAELAERVHTAFHAVLQCSLARAPARGWQMRRELAWRVQRVLVREDLLVPDTEIT